MKAWLDMEKLYKRVWRLKYKTYKKEEKIINKKEIYLNILIYRLYFATTFNWKLSLGILFTQ